MQYHANWERICDQVRDNIQSRIRKIKGVDINTFWCRSHCWLPGASHGAALKDAGENKSNPLARDDSHHNNGHASKGFIAESHVQREYGELDEAKRGVVKD